MSPLAHSSDAGIKKAHPLLPEPCSLFAGVPPSYNLVRRAFLIVNMVDWNRIFGLLRVVIIYFTTLSAVLVLSIGAWFIAFGTFADDNLVNAWFAIASASLTLLTLPLMLILSIYRKGAFTSMVAVELVVTGILWILWLGTSGATLGNPTLQFYCRNAYYYYNLSMLQVCVETDVLAAFSFVNWIMLMVFNVTLFVLAVIQSKRGNTIWTNDVTDVDFLAPAPIAQAPINPQAYSDGANPPQPQHVPGPGQQPQQYTTQQQLRFSHVPEMQPYGVVQV